jgi:cytochrome oxidase Cu insertion factor (SCO1/SenC/PrrC family)
MFLGRIPWSLFLGAFALSSVILGGLTAGCAQSPANAVAKKAGLAQGVAAPDFELSDHEGKKTRLADFRGKRLLIWFYPKASSGG